jgi:glyoxylase-like metal-dependent hydrolase (beta-lactamase superfamily II)
LDSVNRDDTEGRMVRRVAIGLVLAGMLALVRLSAGGGELVLFDAPRGAWLASMRPDAAIQVLEERDGWRHVRVDGWILVDCGVDIPSVLTAYELAGVQWSDIRGIILTHVHPDHSGLSARIRRQTGAPVVGAGVALGARLQRSR